MEQDALTAHAPVPPRPRPPWRQPASWLALGALVLAGWLGFDLRARLSDLHGEVARRLAAADAAAAEARALAKQNQETLAALQARLGALEARLAEAQSQQTALEAMVQELTRNRDERLLAEIEQALNSAAQQLQLAGNVEAALIALQGADQRLAASGRAHFLPLRKVIGRDIERLKALPLADVAGVALRIEAVLGSLDSLPLAFEAKPRGETAAAPAAAASGTTRPAWERFFGELWRELKGLIRIERLDRPTPALLAPEQAFFLRENLRLRLLAARLALLQRDGTAFRQDIRQAQTWLEQHFDTRARSVQAALATLRQLAATDLAPALPGLQESLTVLRNLRLSREAAAAGRERDAR